MGVGIPGTVASVVIIVNALKRKVNPEISDEEYQVQWGNGAPDQYKDKQLNLMEKIK